MADFAAKAVKRIRKVAAALPEVEESESDFAVLFRIRRDFFAHVWTIPDRSGGKPATFLVCRPDPEEGRVLLAIGHPYFEASGGFDRIGVMLSDETDWDEIDELITESYRRYAPKYLSAKLGDRPVRSPRAASPARKTPRRGPRDRA